jgi:hypothetical protein
MRYIEIYGADIDDVSLSDNIRLANLKLIAKGKEHGATGIESLKNESVKVFPNPTQNFFTAQIPDAEFNIIVSDISGRKIFCENKVTNKIHVSCLNFPNGLYIISLETTYKKFYHSVIIKHSINM